MISLLTLCLIYLEQCLAQRRNSNEFLKLFSYMSHSMLTTSLKSSGKGISGINVFNNLLKYENTNITKLLSDLSMIAHGRLSLELGSGL